MGLTIFYLHYLVETNACSLILSATTANFFSEQLAHVIGDELDSVASLRSYLKQHSKPTTNGSPRRLMLNASVATLKVPESVMASSQTTSHYHHSFHSTTKLMIPSAWTTRDGSQIVQTAVRCEE